MATDSTDEAFDEEELAEGFDEEIVDDDLDDVDGADGEDLGTDDEEDLGDEGLDGEDDEAAVEGDDDEEAAPAAAVIDDEELVDDTDVELALDEVLAETIRRTTTTEDDEDLVGEVDPNAEFAEVILPKQDDEFRCSSCRLLKKKSQLADEAKLLCRDCV